MYHFNIRYLKSESHEMPYLHNHSYYELYFQISGTQRFYCDNKSYELNGNAFVCCHPGILHKFEGGPYERFLVTASTDMLTTLHKEYLDELSSKGALNFAEQDMEKIHKLLNKMLRLNFSLNRKNELLISCAFSELLCRIYQSSTSCITSSLSLQKSPRDDQTSVIILKIMNYIKLNYTKPLSYKQVCSHFHLSKIWIYKEFKQANGITIFDYKTALQLNAAKVQLQNDQPSIEKIAKNVGFSSANYFCRVFKKNFHVTPMQYRQQTKEKNKPLNIS